MLPDLHGGRPSEITAAEQIRQTMLDEWESTVTEMALVTLSSEQQIRESTLYRVGATLVEEALKKDDVTWWLDHEGQLDILDRASAALWVNR